MQCLTSLQIHKFLSSQVLKFTSSKYITDITTSSQVFKFFYDGGWSNGGGPDGGGQMAEAQTAVRTAAVQGTSVTSPATTQAYSTPPIDSAKQNIYCI